MDDTAAVRKKILSLWSKFDSGKLPTSEARTHIGFARTVLETLKVEIAAAHLAQVSIPSVPIAEDRALQSSGRRRLT